MTSILTRFSSISGFSQCQLKFHRDVQTNHEELELPKFTTLAAVPYTQFMAHGAFKMGVEPTDWEIKNIFKGCFTLLYNSPARRSDYTSITGSTVFPLSFCATRWVEDKKVVERLVSIWPSIVKIVNIGRTFQKVNFHMASLTNLL